MISLAVFINKPFCALSVGLGDVNGRIENHKFSELLTHRLHVSFHFAFVFRMLHPAGIDETAVMSGHLPVGAIQFWIIDVRFDDAAFEIVDQDSSGNAAKIIEHSNMGGGKTLLILFVNKLDKLVAAV